MIITTVDQLKAAVDEYRRYDAFAYDTETRPSSDIYGDAFQMPADEVKRLSLNTRRNEVFWVSLATYGRSDVIPIGHPRGKLTEPAHDAMVLPPLEERKVTKTGKVSMAKKKVRIPDQFGPPPPQLAHDVVFELLYPLLYSDRRMIGHNIKFDVLSTIKYYDGELPPAPFGDTGIVQHLLDENLRSYGLEALLVHNFSDRKAKHIFNPYEKEGKLGSKGVQNFAFDVAARYSIIDSTWTWHLWQELWPRIQKDPYLLRLHNQLEIKVLECLLRMESVGAPIDADAMHDYGNDLRREIDEIRRNIFSIVCSKVPPAAARRLKIAPYPDGSFDADPLFNPSSNVQKGWFIYDVCKKRPPKRTATGKPSTDKDTLESFAADQGPVGAFVQQCMRLSSLEKILGTYVEGLEQHLVEGRLHPSFRQNGTVTGRFSCSDPNLQNIPRASDDPKDPGARIRGMFVAPPGHTLIVADYDQVELRLIAHFSGDKTMIKTFLDGLDIHAMTAAMVLGIDLAQVSKEKRQVGKTINFGIGFGMGPDKMAASLGITKEQAQGHLNEYWLKFHRVKKWKAEVVSEAKGRRPPHVRTLFGRMRRLPELYADDYQVRGRAERQAVNTLIQGSAADIMKRSMVRLFSMIDERDFPLQPIVTVHDELVSIVPKDRVEEGMEMVKEAMAFDKLKVPLLVSIKSADRWSEGK